MSNGVELTNNRILGINLGLVHIITMSIYDRSTKSYPSLEWDERVIDGHNIIHMKKQIANRKEKMIHMVKMNEYINDNYNIKLKHTEADIIALDEKFKAFKNKHNGKIANYVVNFAFKNNCNTIQMENLDEILNYCDNNFLQEWNYYNLQEQIKDKANKRGLKVSTVKLCSIYNKCSRCNNIHPHYKKMRNHRAKFKCKNCGYEENAGINYSNNIAFAK